MFLGRNLSVIVIEMFLCASNLLCLPLIRLTILSIIRMKSMNPIHIKQQLSMMNPETRVVIIHTTSYVHSSPRRSSFAHTLHSIRTLASIIVKQASNMSLTGMEYMWIMSSVVLCKSNQVDRDPC